jgi:hypothetical protein
MIRIDCRLMLTIADSNEYVGIDFIIYQVIENIISDFPFELSFDFSIRKLIGGASLALRQLNLVGYQTREKSVAYCTMSSIS